MMKKLICLLLLFMLVCASAAASDVCTWSIGKDGVLRISMDTTSLEADGWTVSLSDAELITVQEEAFVSSQNTEDTDAQGQWVVSLKPVQDAAGIVTVTLVCQPLGSDEPTDSVEIEIYLDGTGRMTVLSVNGEEENPLPFN